MGRQKDPSLSSRSDSQRRREEENIVNKLGRFHILMDRNWAFFLVCIRNSTEIYSQK